MALRNMSFRNICRTAINTVLTVAVILLSSTFTEAAPTNTHGANRNSLPLTTHSNHVIANDTRSSTNNSRSVRSATGCVAPSDEMLKQQWISHTTSDLHESFYSLDSFKKGIQSELNKSKFEQFIYLGHDNDQCPDSQQITSTYLNDRSNCPWIYILNWDSERYPSEIVEAHCRKCDKCIGLSSNTRYTCQSEYYNIKVLRKTDQCENGYIKYENSWQRVRVGCTCALRAGIVS